MKTSRRRRGRRERRHGGAGAPGGARESLGLGGDGAVDPRQDAAVQSTRDLNTLADLIGAAAAATATDNFKLNLFPDTDAGYGGGGDSATIPTITISRKEAVSRANAGLVGIMDEMRIEGGAAPPLDDDDDLLGLMDSAN